MTTIKPLPFEKSGNAQSDQLVVFLHGWPDTTQLWDKIIPEFEKNHLVLAVSYPNFSEKEQNKWGETFDGVADRLKATLDQENQAKRKVTFVAHDWGATFTYFFDKKYPGYLTDLIALDVSPWVKPNLFVVIYQLILVFAFLIGGPIGNFIISRVLKYFKYNPPYKNRINSSWGYPYYYTWKSIIKAKGKYTVFAGYFPSCPIAYVYGTQKPAQFHTPAWLKKVSETPNSSVHELKCGHWIMKDQPAFVIDLIKKRLLQVARKI